VSHCRLAIEAGTGNSRDTNLLHQMLGNIVLQQTPEAGSLRLDAEAFHSSDHFFIELCAEIID